MRSLAESMSAHTNLELQDQTWLTSLVREWHLLADVAFSDLILWLPDRDDDIYWAGAQVRPNTGPTALEDDVVGDQIRYDPEHLVTAAFLSAEICETSDNQLSSGIPVDVWAIPVVRGGSVIAVVERHTNRMGVRAPGALEDAYLEAADILTSMLWHGSFPVEPASDPRVSPRVGDGLILTGPTGLVSFASPNALSAYRRLGLSGELVGEDLTAVAQGMLASNPQIGQVFSSDLRGERASEFDIEAASATVRMRVVPLTGPEERLGTLVLCRDLTELRHRDRALVTKDATIREIHHRVKNNLQTVAALLRLQSRRVSAPEAKVALGDAMNRVRAIAAVHEILSQSFNDEVAFDEVADKILQMVGDVSTAQGLVDARRLGSFGTIPAAMASPLALVVTELCHNAAEHGLRLGGGRVWVLPQRESGVLRVDVVDEGSGLPEDFDSDAVTSLGLAIVTTLVSDLGGVFTLRDADPDLSLDSGGTPGAVARVVVPVSEEDR